MKSIEIFAVWVLVVFFKTHRHIEIIGVFYVSYVSIFLTTEYTEFCTELHGASHSAFMPQCLKKPSLKSGAIVKELPIGTVFLHNERF
jgi:c-di-AMP phosphodiesterase-like protein